MIFGFIAKVNTSDGVPYPLFAMCRPAAMAVFLQCDGGIRQQPGEQLEPDFQDLFPAHDRAGEQRGDEPGGFFHLLCAHRPPLFAYYRFVPGPDVIFLPLFILLAFASAMGIGLFVGALMAQFRDFRFILPFVTQIGIFASPVYYMTQSRSYVWHGINPPARLIYST